MAIGKPGKNKVQVIPTPKTQDDVKHIGITKTEAKKKQDELKKKIK